MLLIGVLALPNMQWDDLQMKKIMGSNQFNKTQLNKKKRRNKTDHGFFILGTEITASGTETII
jgi:hypothetical protein